ncbi:MAG: hypothetical protein WBP64_14695 [Nitrososphaeraceae archaeon]
MRGRDSDRGYNTDNTERFAITDSVDKGIQSTEMRSDFYHYLSWKIQPAGLPQEIVRKYNNFVICKSTTGSWKSIELFVDDAIKTFNRYHPTQSTLLLQTPSQLATMVGT